MLEEFYDENSMTPTSQSRMINSEGQLPLCGGPNSEIKENVKSVMVHAHNTHID